jgi:hypothetical protein
VIQTWGTPTCSWPLQVRGTASRAQAGLVRCYLRALASRDTAGLMGVAAYIPPARITKADFTHSADARRAGHRDHYAKPRGHLVGLR